MAAPMNPLQNKLPRVRFSARDDIFLLQEVVDVVPFENPAKWALVASNLERVIRKKVSARAARERTDLLLLLFVREDRRNLRK